MALKENREVTFNKFAQDLSAGTAGRHRVIRIQAVDSNGFEFPDSPPQGRCQGISFGADCEAKRAVFNICTPDYFTITA